MSDLEPWRKHIAHCPDCGASVGEVHADVCDQALCHGCGRQQISCFDRHPRGADRWTGTDPRFAACERLGWFALPAPGWPRCEPGTPGAWPDLNRLYAEAEWDPQAYTWNPQPPTVIVLLPIGDG